MIEIDIAFDTYKALTALRTDQSTTYDDVIRDLLRLPKASGAGERAGPRKAWTYKGVTLPHGTDLRVTYKGELRTAKIEDGEWIQDGRARSSPSEAANAITNTSVNGWTFWEARLPGETRWRLLKALR
jgi:hypothetical protein